MMNSLVKITRERELQKGVHLLLSDPSVVRSTISGRRLQVLSPGRINVHPGPDFLDVAILLDGTVLVGDAEFHRKSSEWEEHRHSDDDNYRNVILHLVVENNSTKDYNFETLIIDDHDLSNSVKALGEEDKTADIDSLDELQHYALMRLLRKSSEAQKLLNKFGMEKAFLALAADFIKRYDKKRRYPVYNAQKFETLLSGITSSPAFSFLADLKKNKTFHVSDSLQMLLKTKLSVEGAHLRRELILNCILPMAVCIAGEQARIALFLWYWSTPSLHKYGILTRRFEKLSQNFLWQQQGMLEYLREHGKKKNIISETINQYGFAELLSFYKIGKSPYGEVTLDDD